MRPGRRRSRRSYERPAFEVKGMPRRKATSRGRDWLRARHSVRRNFEWGRSPDGRLRGPWFVLPPTRSTYGRSPTMTSEPKDPAPARDRSLIDVPASLLPLPIVALALVPTGRQSIADVEPHPHIGGDHALRACSLRPRP